ncbi:single-stranded DNA-binding protein, partial [Helicobacter sp. WB40]|uniref:single-stranded DNA-binding protein n=1 Tax=Helicobacter sp. WB40 TaxID=3004130 RepID=UPI0022EBDE65
MNKIILCGYLGKDFELVIGKNTYAKTSIAISESREKDGQNEVHTNWFPIIIFGRRAEVAHKYFKKGDKFLGSGKIHTSSFT